MTLLQRVQAILLAPDSEWRVIDQESGNAATLFGGYVVYLAAVPAVAGFIGMSLVGFTVPAVGSVRVGLLSGLLAAVFAYVLAFVAVYIMALIIDALAPSFDGRKDRQSALKLATYSFTPAWIAGIFLLVPGLHFLTILGLYGFYLLYRGLPVLMDAPDERAMTYAGAVAGCGIALGLIFGAIRAAIFALPGIL